MLDQLVGQNLGQFKVISLLGEGGMGAVFKGFDVTLQRDVAIKVMHPHIARQPDFQERFLQEARTAARLDHPGIVQVYHFGSARSLLYIVMKYIPGANLERMLRDLKTQGKWIQLAEAVRLLRQIALALDYAHQQGVLHRDIKPGNIMVEPTPGDGLPYRPVITDLGLAKLVEGGIATSDGVSMGTPAYMSPEQATGKAVDARSDVYSLGVLLFELSTGQLPFPIKTITEAVHYHTTQPPPAPRSIRPEVPEELEKVILKALEKDPAKRLSSAGELAGLLDGVQIQSASTAAPTALEGAVSLITEYQKSLIESRGPSILQEFKTPTSPGRDCIQVMLESKTETVPLKPGGLKIGRDPDNDLVLDDPKISRHHAQIDFDGSNYRVTDMNSSNGSYLGNLKLLPGIPEVWPAEKALRLGNAWLRLARARQATTEPTRRGFESLGVDASRIQTSPGDGCVGIYLDPAQLTVDPGQSARMPVILLNQSSLVDKFTVSMSGIPDAWVRSGTKTVQMMPGDQQEVELEIEPPRLSQSKAGRYPLSVTVASHNDASQVAEARTSLTVSAYQQFNCDLQPQKLRIGQTGRIIVQNKGNVKETFKVSLKDRGDELSFHAAQGQLIVPEGQAGYTDFRASLRRRAWLGGETSHPFSAQVIPSKGDPQTLGGEVVSKAILPIWVLPLFILFCLLLGGGAAAVYPIIFPSPTPTSTPTATPLPTATALPTSTATPTSTPEPGKPVFDIWCIYASGSPPEQLTGCQSQVVVPQGQKVSIQWQVKDAEEVQISPLGDRPLNGQEEYLPLENTSFTLRASNQGKTREATIQVIVESISPTQAGTPTPGWLPDLQPARLEDPQAANITAIDMVDPRTGWAVSNLMFAPANSLLRTTNGGAAWRNVTPESGYPPGSRFFALDGQRAWAVPWGLAPGDGEPAGVVWRTSDGGINWRPSQPVIPHVAGYNVVGAFSPQALYFLDEKHGWLVVSIDLAMPREALAILATSDGGITWETVADKFSMDQSPEGTQGYAPMPCQVNGITFVDPQNGYLAGSCLDSGQDEGFSILRTGDGGRNWSSVFTNPTHLPPPLEAAMAEGRSVCGATGVENYPAGILVQHTCLVQEESGRSTYFYLSLLPKVSDAWLGWPGETAAFSSPSDGLSVGQMQDGARTLSATMDGGKTWQEVRTVTWPQVRIDYLNSDQGFALAWQMGNQEYFYAFMRTDDRGRNWTLVEGGVQ